MKRRKKMFVLSNVLLLMLTMSALQLLSGNDPVHRDVIEIDPLNAAFIADTTSGPAPLTVNFTDQSTGLISEWFWDFGDGSTSEEQNPEHTFQSGGYYSVILEITGENGTSSQAMEYIEVYDAFTLSGRVVNAVTGQPIPEVYISVSERYTFSNENGEYSIAGIPRKEFLANFGSDTTEGEVPLTVQFINQSGYNQYQVLAQKNGYYDLETSVTIHWEQNEATHHFAMTPLYEEGEGLYRIVLTWQEEPRDLDSHIITPPINDVVHHVYYGNPGSKESPPYITLDIDIVDSYGPETITVYELYPGEYTYFVHNYSGESDLAGSGALVNIYDENGLKHTVQVPDSGAGIYWNVFSLDGITGEFHIQNTISETSEYITYGISSSEKYLPDIKETALQYLWDFGDDTFSTEKNPVKTYTIPGVYTVSLTVNPGDNEIILVKEDYIHAFAGTVQAPTFTPVSGVYHEPKWVEIESETPDANIHYTLDGSNPGINSPVYDGPIPVEKNTTIKAFATKPDWNDSDITEAEYSFVYTEPALVLSGHEDFIRTIAYSPDGESVLTGSFDKKAILWDVYEGEIIREFTGHSHVVLSAAFSPDGQYIITGSYKQAILWNVQTGEIVRSWNAHNNWIYAVDISSWSGHILTAGDKSAILWDFETGEKAYEFSGHTGLILSAAFSPYGHYIATAGQDNTAIIWPFPEAAYGYYQTTEMTPLQILEHPDWVSSVAFCPHEEMLITGSTDNNARLWDFWSGEVIHTLEGHTGSIFSVAFSLCGQWAATGSEDNTARIWDVDQAQTFSTYAGHDHWVIAVAFSHDSTRLISGSFDKTAMIWQFIRDPYLAIQPSSSQHEHLESSGNEISIVSNILWSAVASDDWITIDSEYLGYGNANLVYSVEENSAATSRNGTITVAGSDINRVFTIYQSEIIPPYDSQVVSHTFPSTLLPQREFTSELIMKNTGYKAWLVEEEFYLASKVDIYPIQREVEEIELINLNHDVEPGQTHSFIITLTSPPEMGIFHLEWQMLNFAMDDYFWFGEVFSHEIEITDRTNIHTELWHLFD